MLLIDNKSLVKWISPEKIEDFLNHPNFTPLHEIRCLHCGRYIRFPIVARERDIELLKMTIEHFNAMLDDILNFVDEHYGTDIRRTLLLEKIMSILKTLELKKPS